MIGEGLDDVSDSVGGALESDGQLAHSSESPADNSVAPVSSSVVLVKY